MFIFILVVPGWLRGTAGANATLFRRLLFHFFLGTHGDAASSTSIHPTTLDVSAIGGHCDCSHRTLLAARVDNTALYAASIRT